MTISIWRYSHLTLALFSAIFILIASITGTILAFEPISEKLNSYNVENINNISISETIAVLQEKHDEILTIEIDENDFVSANIILKNGKNETYYINPKTGEKIGDILEKKSIFKFATNLHRSLFLKSTGRFLIGFASFLLLLIAVTGVLLIGKRQGGISKFFSKIVKENFNQYYHIIIGRYTLIPIIIITLTAVYLSLEKFSLLPKNKSSHKIIAQKKEAKKIDVKDFKVFKTTKLSEIQKIEFPFSKDKEDYFFLRTYKKEIAIQQYTGQIISHKKENLASFGSYYSLILHTGKGSIIWSIILLLACFAILFFIFSGFFMTLKRKKQTTLNRNKFYKDNAEFIILVGSETGSTFNFANVFYNALITAGKKVFLSELNEYASYKKAKNIIIFTATYGEGEAPINANKFIEKISKIHQNNILRFSVVGFGSLEYPQYCKFALLVQANLELQEKFIPISPIFKINNQSFSDFNEWLKEWNSFYKTDFTFSEDSLLNSQKKKEDFTVIHKTEINIDNTFLIQLKPNKKTKFKSGDLLSITPKNDYRNRLYSIAKIDNTILLSIKKHEFGLCSNYFNGLNNKDKVIANIQENKNFHFPKKTKEVILIANGTGIAPFLGMINGKKSKIRIHLFWGGRTKESFYLYQKNINSALKNKKLTSFFAAYSKEKSDTFYVQDLLKNETKLITDTLKNGNIIMICGSNAMLKGVKEVLEEISKNHLESSLQKYKDNNQIKIDCY